ncbi:MAG: hypothetical protein WC373_10520 [Smithella sp.]|jgi:hypothetical protein
MTTDNETKDKLISSTEIIDNLGTTVPKTPSSESQTRPLDRGTNVDAFDNLKLVMAYLQAEGWKIKKSNLYNHRKQGKISPERDGKYLRPAVDKYARTFLRQIVTGKRIQENLDDQQRVKLEQEIRINELKIKNQERRNAIEEKKYIAVPVVLDTAFTMFRHARDAMLTISDRITPILAGETDENKVREILDNEIRQAIERLDRPEAVIGN